MPHVVHGSVSTDCEIVGVGWHCCARSANILRVMIPQVSCLLAHRYALALGWYVVRNPSQAALVRGTSGILARQQEEAFFGSTPPWNRLALASKSRLGKHGWLHLACTWKH